MSRNFTADQILTERLIINDTKAFEELYRRYWYSLYFYGLRKLQSKEESRHLVQQVFVDLWQQRHSFTASLHLAQHLYEEGKRDVCNRLDQRMADINESALAGTELLAETNLESNEAMHSASGESVTMQRKLVRYVNDHTLIPERRTQLWLSETKINTYLTSKEKDQLEDELLEAIQGRTAYLLFYPKKESPWWQKIAAMF